jgi:hypothetical protein
MGKVWFRDNNSLYVPHRFSYIVENGENFIPMSVFLGKRTCSISLIKIVQYNKIFQP